MKQRSMTVFVTGASAGFGEAIARRFVSEGHRVVATARRGDRLEALAEELGEHLLPVELDIRDRERVIRAVAALPADFAAIDLLVNNAGLAARPSPVQDSSFGDWEQMLDTNCKGLLSATAAVLSGMVERGRGHIINIGSIGGNYPYPRGNVYAATKAFVHQFSLNLLADLHGTGLRVTCIEPGMAETEFSVARFGGDQQKADAVYAGMQPLTAEDVAESVHWAAAQPAHVNINTIELMPTDQSFGGFRVDSDRAEASGVRSH